MNHHKNAQIDSLSFASVISSIAVIFLHSNGVFWFFKDAGYWKTANVIECLFYFAVPVFFMISGATLMDYRKRYDTRTFFKKRFIRTVIPYFGWSFIGLVFSTFYLNRIAPNDITLEYLVNGLLQGSLYAYVFWFFIPLFMIYLSIPLFSAIPAQRQKSLFSYLAIAAFLLQFAIPFVITITKTNIQYTLSIPSMGGYLFYCLAGYLLVHNELKRSSRLILYSLALAGLLMHMVGTYTLSLSRGCLDETFKGYLNLPCALYSIGSFVFLKQLGTRMMSYKIVNKVILFLKGYTFPFYLMHLFVLDILSQELHLNIYSLRYRLLSPLAAIAIIIPVTWLLRRIPFFKRLVP